MLKFVLVATVGLASGVFATELSAPAEERFQQDVAWSPDGRRIAFINGGWPKSAVYIFNAVDSTVTKIIN